MMRRWAGASTSGGLSGWNGWWSGDKGGEGTSAVRPDIGGPLFSLIKFQPVLSSMTLLEERILWVCSIEETGEGKQVLMMTGGGGGGGEERILGTGTMGDDGWLMLLCGMSLPLCLVSCVSVVVFFPSAILVLSLLGIRGCRAGMALGGKRAARTVAQVQPFPPLPVLVLLPMSPPSDGLHTTY